MTTPTPKNQTGVSHRAIQKSVIANKGLIKSKAITGRLKLKSNMDWSTSRINETSIPVQRIVPAGTTPSLSGFVSIRDPPQDKQKKKNAECLLAKFPQMPKSNDW